MQVVRNLQELPDLSGCVVTIGTFDGVHKGHCAIIDRITADARARGGKSVIITFHPHPRQIITPGSPVYHLTTLEEKLQILEQKGVDVVVVVPFSREFSEISAEAYAEDFLIKQFRPAVIVFGYDHKFGRNRSGDIHLLKNIAATYHIHVEEIPAHLIDSLTVSSSQIRKFLLQGDVDAAKELLGYPYALTGPVVKGDQIGRTLGFPTANIFLEDSYKLIPADGVYVVRVRCHNRASVYNGLLSIGNRPTFNKTEKRIEAFILDFNEIIYGERITVELLHFIRPDRKFENVSALIEAMENDVRNARTWLDAHTDSGSN